MLIFSFRVGERAVIDIPAGCAASQIIVTCVGNDHCHMRMGFDAPRNIAIDREKIWMRKRGEIDGNR